MGEARDNGSSVPAAPAPDGVGFLLARVGLAVARQFAARLDPLGLEPRQMSLLRAVAEAGGQSQQALGERLRIPPSRMVALVDELERRALVERRRNPVDRRAHALHLTEAGGQLLARALDVACEHEAEVCATLTGTERDRLVTLLHRVADGLANSPCARDIGRPSGLASAPATGPAPGPAPGLAPPPDAGGPCGEGSEY